MLSSIWAKLVAFMGVVIAGLLAFIKFRSDKIERLEEKTEVSDKLNDIRETQEESKKEILKDEKKRIDTKLKIKPTHTRRDRVKRMRRNKTSPR